MNHKKVTCAVTGCQGIYRTGQTAAQCRNRHRQNPAGPVSVNSNPEPGYTIKTGHYSGIYFTEFKNPGARDRALVFIRLVPARAPELRNYYETTAKIQESPSHR